MCQREGVVDFAELLLRSYELLAGNEAIRKHYQRRFSHLLVDEFQDTNVLQYRWLQMLAGTDAAVFAVGDDDQSIYAFRGANVANMQHFERDFAAPDVPVRLVKLEQNYRSHGTILDAANALIRHNRARLGKNLWTSEGKGEPLRAFVAPSDLDEAAFVVDIVRNLGDEGVPLSEVALLYRSNAQSRVLEHALFGAGLPYRVYGGMRFFERVEVKHALAYLRLLATPDDDGALLRVINFPARGVGARSLEQLQDHARGAGTTLWQAACSGVVGGRAGGGVAVFVKLIERLRHETASLPLPEAVAHHADEPEESNAGKGRQAQGQGNRAASLLQPPAAIRGILRDRDPDEDDGYCQQQREQDAGDSSGSRCPKPPVGQVGQFVAHRSSPSAA